MNLRKPIAASPDQAMAVLQSLRRHKLHLSVSDIDKLTALMVTLQSCIPDSPEWRAAYGSMLQKGRYLELAGNQAEFDELLTRVFTSAKTDLPVQQQPNCLDNLRPEKRCEMSRD